jgi:hypothetical protein
MCQCDYEDNMYSISIEKSRTSAYSIVGNDVLLRKTGGVSWRFYHLRSIHHRSCDDRGDDAEMWSHTRATLSHATLIPHFYYMFLNNDGRLIAWPDIKKQKLPLDALVFGY